MKILKLTFKNLNSLYGKWEIDFEHPAYQDNGIFALTGPTGAGKSTILDAICLALYGQTPRLGKITQTASEIMSRHTGECAAELIFETNEGRYLSQWGQRRARGKADGKLQDTSLELSQWDNSLGEYCLISNKKSEAQELIIQKTGMDFARFTRSILLAQGSFDSFLKASEGSKSDILEDITGTAIYTEISKAVHVRKTLEESTLNELQAETRGITLLSAEELVQYEQENKQALAQEQTLQNTLKQLNTEIKWHQDIAQCTQDLAQTQSAQQALSLRQQAFLPKREQLAIATAAASIRSEFTSLNTLRYQQKNTLEQQQDLQTQQAKLEQEQHSAQEAYTQSDKQLLEAKSALQSQEPIFKQVRTLKTQLAEKQTRYNELKETYAKEQKDFIDLEQQQKTLLKDIETLRTSQLQGLEHINQNPTHENIVTDIATIEIRLNQLEDIQSKIKQTQQNKLDLQNEIPQAQQILEGSSVTVQSIKDKIQVLISTHTEIQQQLATISHGKSLAEYRQELEQAIIAKNLIKNIHDSAELRTHLVKGEPCPVCGATEHPYADENTIPALNSHDGIIETLKNTISTIEDYEKALQDNTLEQNKQAANLQLQEQGIENLKQALNKAETRLASVRQELANHQEQHQNTLDLLQQSLEKYELDCHQEAKELIAQLQHYQNLWVQAQLLAKGLQPKIDNAEKEAFGLKTQLETNKSTLLETQKQLELQAQDCENIRQEINACFGDKDVDSEENALKGVVIQAEQQISLHRQALNEANASLNKNKALIESLQTQLRTIADDKDKAEQAFIHAYQSKGFTDESNYQQAVLDSTTLTALQQEQQALDTEQTRLSSVLQERQTRLEALQRQNLSTQPLEVLTPQLAEFEQKLNQHIASTATIREKLATHARNQARFAQQQHKIEAQQQELNRWKQLHELIGSANGTKYRNFVQGITFDIMISHANQQLRKMSDRYLLLRDKHEPLSLNVLDNYQAGEIRTVKNLSGGESFMVSLALALGLSKMSSKNVRVDSLFLDEGFGTLDEETLETALDTLSSLQADNKTIGVISHVSALKNRISTQIEIKPISGGRSEIEGAGVRLLTD